MKKALILVAAILLLAGCGPKKETLKYGKIITAENGMILPDIVNLRAVDGNCIANKGKLPYAFGHTAVKPPRCGDDFNSAFSSQQSLWNKLH